MTSQDVAAERKIDLDELVRKYEVESRFRKLSGLWGQFVKWLGVLMCLFHLYAALTGGITSFKLRVTHLAFSMLLIVVYYPHGEKSNQERPTWWDVVLGVTAVGTMVYMLINFDTMAIRGMESTTLDLIVGGFAILSVIETARRCNGMALPVLSVIFLGYAVLGPYLPILDHRGYSLQRIIEQMYMGSEGIFGVPLGVSADIIFVYILFGAVLAATGVSKLFANLAMALAGHTSGGPARVAVVSSAFFGMINGSAAANAISTGAVTIPLMRSTGYKPAFAAAVEAVASTGGQIMPPVMGAAAFIMAEFLGVSYGTVALAALVPALLFFWSIWVQVGLEAKKEGLGGIPKEQLPRVRDVLRDDWHLLVPVVSLLGLLYSNYTPAYAAVISTGVAIVVSWFRKETRMTLDKLINAMVNASRGALSVAAATAVVGLVIGVFTMTGLGLRLANLILDLSGGNLHITLVLTAVASLVLGLGLPTSACYIMAATAAAPALIKGGIPPTAAHMFVLYFGVLAAITPPDALAAYAAASIAGADPWKTGWRAVWLGLCGYIVPFMFIYSPGLLLNGDPLQIGWAIVSAMIGVYALGGAVEGYWRYHCAKWERIGLFIAALCLIDQGLITDAIGFGTMGLVWILQTQRAKVAGGGTAQVSA